MGFKKRRCSDRIPCLSKEETECYVSEPNVHIGPQKSMSSITVGAWQVKQGPAWVPPIGWELNNSVTINLMN